MFDLRRRPIHRGFAVSDGGARDSRTSRTARLTVWHPNAREHGRYTKDPLEPRGVHREDEQATGSDSDWPHLSDLDLDVCVEPTRLPGQALFADGGGDQRVTERRS